MVQSNPAFDLWKLRPRGGLLIVALTLVALAACGSDDPPLSSTDASADVGDASSDAASDVSADASADGADSGDPVRLQSASGRVVLPEGSALDPTTLTATNGWGEDPVAADGTFTLTVAGPGPTMLIVVDDEGRTVLLGYVDPAEEREVGSHSTAVALTWIATGLWSMPTDVQLEYFRQLEAHSSVAGFGRAVEHFLGQEDPYALMTEHPELLESLENAVRLITEFEEGAFDKGLVPKNDPPSNANVLVQPTEPQSGVLVGPNIEGSGIQVTNYSRRSGWYYVYRTGYETTESGQPVEVDPPELVAEGWMRATNGLQGTATTIFDAFSGRLDFSARQLQAPIPVNVPDGQRRVFYEAIVAGSHIPFYSRPPRWADDDDPRVEEWEDRATLMTAVSVTRDVVFPIIFSIVRPVGSALQGDDAFVTWSSLAEVMLSQVPGVATEISAGDWSAAAQLVLKALANNEGFRNTVALALAELLIEDLRGYDDIIEKFASANFLVAAVDVGVAATDIALVVSDHVDANALERWEATAIRARVLLGADRYTLDDAHTTASLYAEVAGSGPSDYFCYLWTLDGPGELSNFLPGPDTGDPLTLVSAEPEAIYLIDQSDLVDGPIAVFSVTAYPRESDESCTAPPAGEPVGEGRLVIDATTEPFEPCTEEFDYAFWQSEENGLSLSTSGRIGGTVTASINLPPAGEDGDDYRDLIVYFPWPAETTRDAVTTTGDVRSVQSVRREDVLYWIRQDDAFGPVYTDRHAEVRVSARGAITIALPTQGPDVACGVDLPGSRPCCPFWNYHETFDYVFVGDFVLAAAGGGSYGGTWSMAPVTNQ